MVRSSRLFSSVYLVMAMRLLPVAAFLAPSRHHPVGTMDHNVGVVVSSVMTSSHPHHRPSLTWLDAKAKAAADSTTPSGNATTTTTTTTNTAWQDLSQAAQDVWESIRDAPERYKVKQDLILQGASFDRGFGASPSARQNVADMVQELVGMNPYSEDEDVTRHFVTGKQQHDDDQDNHKASSPLKGTWVLVWTTAQDVLALNASPFTVAGAIYQVMEPPFVTNIVDFIPRAQELVAPDKIRSTLFRGKVKKKATAATASSSSPAVNSKNTLDLTLESFNVKAVEVLGRKTGAALPAWAVNIPKLPGTPSDTNGFGNNNNNGQFRQQVEICYLDDTMMITKQKAPGGTNVFVKVPDAEV